MSTDHQKYSTENQLETIRKYAEQRGFDIVSIYEDSGRSGLKVDGRDGLLRLMKDVQLATPLFKAILVYDVSRWGRFQDADEGAYHEHICSRQGIRVHYCGEQFDNDGSIGATLLKSVKRVMAGEYSRELSVKVFAGQCRLVEHGFRQGGPAGYGLRRQLIDESRNTKALLGFGERKSLQTDRVVLTLGPPDEVQQVRRIYELFVDQRLTERQIADLLNSEGVLSDRGMRWSRSSVRQILTNEKYIGNNVFNRVSFKLKKHRTVNHPDTWVRAVGAFPSAIDVALFERARSLILERSQQLSDDELLSILRSVLDEEGSLSGFVIDERADVPSSCVYRYRFGSLIKAYTLIGYVPDRDFRYIEINRRLREKHPGLVAAIVDDIRNVGATVTVQPQTQLLTINNEFTASLVISRCIETRGGLRWHLRLDTGLIPDLTIAVRMNAQNDAPRDYYLLPSIGMNASRIKFGEDNAFSLDAFRFDTLEPFLSLVTRQSFLEAA